MKYKTDELEGALLDAAVVLALGLKGNLRDGRAECYLIPFDTGPSETDRGDTFSPSSQWSHAGPIIERERIALVSERTGDVITWDAYLGGFQSYEGGLEADPYSADAYGAPTPLIAAMRAFVKSKLGEEVELP